jgi:hypothetical protein
MGRMRPAAASLDHCFPLKDSQDLSAVIAGGPNLPWLMLRDVLGRALAVGSSNVSFRLIAHGGSRVSPRCLWQVLASHCHQCSGGRAVLVLATRLSPLPMYDRASGGTKHEDFI